MSFVLKADHNSTHKSNASVLDCNVLLRTWDKCILALVYGRMAFMLLCFATIGKVDPGWTREFLSMWHFDRIEKELSSSWDDIQLGIMTDPGSSLSSSDTSSVDKLVSVLNCSNIYVEKYGLQSQKARTLDARDTRWRLMLCMKWTTS